MTIPSSVLAYATCLLAAGSFEVVGEASDGEEAIQRARELLPDLVLLDLLMPRLSGLETMRGLLQESPAVKVVLLTSSITIEQMIDALQIGARGIVTKDALAGQLTDALAAVNQGHYWVNGRGFVDRDEALEVLIKASAPDRNSCGLTAREIEIARCIVEGCSNRDIASQFAISEETAKRHLSNIFNKTGASTRLELALFALTRRIVESPQ